MSQLCEAGLDEHGAGFRHDAFFYDGEYEVIAGTASFIREGVDAGEPALVVVDDRKIGLLREELGPDAGGVQFLDMAAVGQNPARIIPVWREFVDANVAAGRPARGIGEPIWAGRSAAELTECQRHESLLNLAFDDDRPWSLLCPYDAGRLADDVLEEACRSHPVLSESGTDRTSEAFRADVALRPFTGELPLPLVDAESMVFALSGLGAVRQFAGERAILAGLGQSRTADLVLAVSELATNSIRHGGGTGSATAWTDGHTFQFEVCDDGVIAEPMVGRVTPTIDQLEGRGLWIANQLCDLVQVRSSEAGSVVRLHMRLS